jgi:hypothetical protein
MRTYTPVIHLDKNELYLLEEVEGDPMGKSGHAKEEARLESSDKGVIQYKRYSGDSWFPPTSMEEQIRVGSIDDLLSMDGVIEIQKKPVFQYVLQDGKNVRLNTTLSIIVDDPTLSKFLSVRKGKTNGSKWRRDLSGKVVRDDDAWWRELPS